MVCELRCVPVRWEYLGVGVGDVCPSVVPVVELQACEVVQVVFKRVEKPPFGMREIGEELAGGVRVSGHKSWVDVVT